ncbi:TVP38/TMEM64 family protein [Fodinicurvata halophila]|uniref:TVP38/TMEM64 family protein n=1 Tax=Fodinicurvata halophila TaxID=1419723 RepID=UPI00362F0069
MSHKPSQPLSDSDAHRSRSARSRLLRSLPLVLLLAAGAVLWFGLGLGDYVSFTLLQEHHRRLEDFVEAYYLSALFGFMLIYALNVAFSLPVGTLLTLTGGFLFGILPATLAAVVAATLGATAVYLAARTALGDVLKRRSGSSLERLRRGFREDAFNYLLTLRLIPLFPFWLVNLAPAFAGVRLGTFFWATLLGILPGTLVYASAGNGLGRILEAGASRTWAWSSSPRSSVRCWGWPCSPCCR